MAQLSNKSVAEFDKREGESWQEHWTRTGEVLDGMAARSAEIPEGGDIKGALIKFPVADGYAHYVVLRQKPLAVAHVPYGDAYQVSAATIRGLREADVRRQLATQRAFAAMDRHNDDFYSSLEEGQTVHYNHGHGTWVRCVAVRGKDKDDSSDRMVLKPVALVGEWREYDLPHRDRSGEMVWGYQATQIREGRTFHPHESTLWESVACVARKRGADDPTAMEAIDISGPPEPEGSAAEDARLWRLVARVREATATTLGDPREKLEAVRSVLKELDAA